MKVCKFSIESVYSLINNLEKIPLIIFSSFILINLFKCFFNLFYLSFNDLILFYFISTSFYFFLKVKFFATGDFYKIINCTNIIIDKMCTKCRKYKFLTPEKTFKTHHCNICNNCYLSRFAHCIYFNTCIYYGNIGEYFLFLNTFGSFLVLKSFNLNWNTCCRFKLAENFVGYFLIIFGIFKTDYLRKNNIKKKEVFWGYLFNFTLAIIFFYKNINIKYII